MTNAAKKVSYYICSCISNIKGDPDTVLYVVEPSDGGGIEFTSEDIKLAEEYVKSVNGFVEYYI